MLRRRATAVSAAAMVLMVLTGCGYWRPFSDAVVGDTPGGVTVVEFGGAGTGYRGDAITTTDGRVWRRESPGSSLTDPSEVAGLQVRTEACVPGQPEHCFRAVMGHARVQETLDGGRHWSTAWELTAGRSLFLRRSGAYATDTTGAPLRLDSTSVAVLLTAQGYSVVVADQNDGLVVRRPDGQWDRVGLAGFVADTPWVSAAVPDTGLGHGIVKEYLLGLSTAGSAFLVGIAAAGLRRRTGPGRRAVLMADGLRILLGLLWTAGLDLVEGFYGEPGTGEVATMLLLTGCVMTGLVLLRRTWPTTRRATLALVGASLSVGVLTCLPFLGWTVARPDSYLVACLLAVCLAVGGLLGTGLLGHRVSGTASGTGQDRDRAAGRRLRYLSKWA